MASTTRKWACSASAGSCCEAVQAELKQLVQRCYSAAGEGRGDDFSQLLALLLEACCDSDAQVRKKQEVPLALSVWCSSCCCGWYSLLELPQQRAQVRSKLAWQLTVLAAATPRSGGSKPCIAVL